MLDSEVAYLLKKIDAISRLSVLFRAAYEGGRIEEAREISRQASEAISALVVGMRRLQDAGRCPTATRTVGLWIRNATEASCTAAISEKKIASGEPLSLREALNKFVHVENSTFRFDPNHSMVIVGKLSGKPWIVDFAIDDFCSAARDALYQTEPAS